MVGETDSTKTEVMEGEITTGTTTGITTEITANREDGDQMIDKADLQEGIRGEINEMGEEEGKIKDKIGEETPMRDRTEEGNKGEGVGEGVLLEKARGEETEGIKMIRGGTGEMMEETKDGEEMIEETTETKEDKGKKEGKDPSLVLKTTRENNLIELATIE